MQPEIINARWTIDGISVPYADYFSVLVFMAYVNLIKMHAFIPTISSFKSRPAETKSKYNYKFNFKNRYVGLTTEQSSKLLINNLKTNQ